MIILLSELKLRDVYYQIRNNFPYLRIFTKTLSTWFKHMHTLAPRVPRSINFKFNEGLLTCNSAPSLRIFIQKFHMHIRAI